MSSTFGNIFKDRTVLITGHTGFKGSWLSIWLQQLGANVIGFSLPELPTSPTNFELSKLSNRIADVRGDVRNEHQVLDVIKKYKPSVVFHLAGQPIVYKAYDDPKFTFDTNAGGTINVLEAIRNTDCVEAAVMITTDKVYKNKEWSWGYREDDTLGDVDPYSASKAMAELAIASYRESFLSGRRSSKRRVEVASTRAGNVVGGGDFASYRLVPDCIRALMADEQIKVRNPLSVRPWQHVLEPLSGYIWLASKMLREKSDLYTQAFNFGPKLSKAVTAAELCDMLIELWGHGSWINTSTDTAKHEAGLLTLDYSVARNILEWSPIYSVRETISEIVIWYKEYIRQSSGTTDVDMYSFCVDQIEKYTKKAKELGVRWSQEELIQYATSKVNSSSEVI